MTGLRIAAIGSCLLLVATVAQAAPLTWTVSGEFEDGSAISGSFDYDAATDTYSAIYIVTESFAGWGYVYGDLPFHPINGIVGDSGHLALRSLDSNHELYLLFGAPLTEAGGSFTIGNSGETSFETGGGTREVVFGFATADAPPSVPASGPLGRLTLVAAALALGWIRGRRSGRAGIQVRAR